ncbi:MAG: prenyltransferase/squalene oxidase repeat-containing protein [Armatimonadota bacterium]
MASDHTAAYLRAARSGAAWLAEHQRPDGSFDEGIPAIYKAPYALGLLGLGWEAGQLLTWIAENHLTADGDFADPTRETAYDFIRQYALYPNTWLVLGAHRLGRLDVCYPAAKFVLEANWDRKWGGFYTNGRDERPREMDMLTTSMGGLVGLYLGRLDVAMGVASWLEDLMNGQPESDKLYVCQYDTGEPITSFPNEESRLYVLDFNEAGQSYFYPGIAIAFLCQLYRAVGHRRYLDLAWRYWDWLKNCQDDLYSTPASGKLGYGLALYGTLARDESAMAGAHAVAEYLLGTQGPDGHWSLSADGDGPPPMSPYDVTAEFVVWLAEMAMALGE